MPKIFLPDNQAPTARPRLVNSEPFINQGMMLVPRLTKKSGWFVFPSSLYSSVQQRPFLSPMQRPVRWDWREHLDLLPPPDQRPHNSCLSHAICAAAEVRAQISGITQPLAPRYFHFNDLRLSRNVGTGIKNCEAAAKNYGLPLWVEGADHVTSIQDCQALPTPARMRVAGVFSFPNIEAVKQEISSKGPVVCAIQTYQDFRVDYPGGIYKPTAMKGPADHAMVLIGYDDIGSYWIVKNSYGQGWGIDGYCLYDMEAAGLSTENPDVWAIDI